MLLLLWNGGTTMEDRIFISKDEQDNDIELRFKSLNQVILTKGDFVYRENFSKAIRAGIMTNAEANKLLRDRNIWTEEQERELVDLQIELAQLEDKLIKIKKRDAESLGIFNKIKEVRRSIADINSIRSSVVDNTAESVAAEMRTQFYASECTVYNNSGKKVFRDMKDFLMRLDEKVALDAYRQALINNYERALGIDINNLEDSKLPEDEWLDKLKEVDEDKEKKPKRKTRTRKKTKATKAVEETI